MERYALSSLHALLLTNHSIGNMSSLHALSGMNSLISLDLSTNKFTGNLIPDWCYLFNLQFLDLRENMVTGTLPSEWASFVNLTTLFLGSNHITGKSHLSSNARL